MISSIWSTDNHLTNRKIFFFKCRPRPTVVYKIVIYRQPCALHISWYTVHHPSGVVHCAWSGGYNCFQGVNIPIRGGYINPWIGLSAMFVRLLHGILSEKFYTTWSPKLLTLFSLQHFLPYWIFTAVPVLQFFLHQPLWFPFICVPDIWTPFLVDS